MPSFQQPPFQRPPRQSGSRRSSPSMRLMQGYLQVLRRPVVWGSAVVLLAAGYYLSPYWSNFNPIAQNRSPLPATPRQNPLYPPQTSDPANLSEFGNMPGLGSSIGQPGSLGQGSLGQPGSLGQSGSLGSLGSTAMPSAANQPSSSSAPFALASPQDSTSGGSLSGLPTSANPASHSSGLSNSPVGGTDFIQGTFSAPNSGSSAAGSSASGSSAANPLQSALDRATHSTSTPLNGPASEAPSNSDLPGTLAPSTAAPTSSTATTPSTTPAPSTAPAPSTMPATPLSPVGQSSFQPYVPPGFSSGASSSGASSSGASGYTVPPAFRTPANSTPAASSSGFSNFSRPQPLPGDYSAPLNPPYATQPMLPSGSSSGSALSGGQSSRSFSTP